MAVPDPSQLSLWQQGQTERRRIVRIALGTWHSLLPKLLGWNLHPGRLIFGSIRFIFFLLLSLGPIWLKVYEAALAAEGELPKATWKQAIGLSAFLSFLLTYNFVYDRIITTNKGEKTKRKLLKQLADEVRGTIAGFSPFLRLIRPREDQEQVRIARRKVLEWIRKVAQVHVSDYEGACIEVTLLVFADENGRTMRIEDRTTHARPVGKVITAQEIMAYYVAKSGKHHCVNDFQNDPHPFSKSGLSAHDAPYRSILLIPLLDTEGGAPDNCLGVVSIDSIQPYHFWPGSGGVLVQKVSPFCSWLAVLLNLSESYRLRRSTLP